MPSIQRTLSRGASILSLALFLTPLIGCGGTSPSKLELVGGGSTFVAPIMDKWAKEYGKAKRIKIDYSKLGSGAGVKQATEQTLDFGCTDAPLTEEQTKKAQDKNGDVIQIPLVAGAVVPIYNLPEAKQPLNFTGELLADVFLGKITTWDDPKIKELNPGVDLPATKIATVHRSEASGTTFIFTDFLTKTSKAWETEYRAGKTELAWKGGQGEPKNDGVANFVKTNPGALGYTELAFAQSNNIAFGAVKNKAGKFVLGSADSATAAFANLQEIPENLVFNLNDQPGDASYPICGAVWAVLYVKQPADKAGVLRDFFTWAVTDGQAAAGDLDYAKLSPALVEKIKAKLALVK